MLLCNKGYTAVAVGTLYLVQPLGLLPILLVVLVVLLVPPLLLDNFQASFRGELPPIFAALSDIVLSTALIRLAGGAWWWARWAGASSKGCHPPDFT